MTFFFDKIPKFFEKLSFKIYKKYPNIGSLYYTLGGCYPARYDPKCRPSPHFTDHGSIFFHHRFNHKVQKEIMGDGTKFYTSVREPLSHFYSSFNFFYYRFGNIKDRYLHL